MLNIWGRFPDHRRIAVDNSVHLRHVGVCCLKTRPVLGAAGVLLLLSLGVSALGRDDKPKLAPAPAKAAPAAAKGADDEDEIKQLVAELAAAFRRHYRAELNFMRSATNLNKREYEKIAAEGEPAMKAALQKWARNCQQGTGDYFNPVQPMTDAIILSVHKHLSPEQADQYEKEIGMRLASRKRMTVANLVVMIDKALFLSPEQRQQLADLLKNNWDESWSQTRFFMFRRPWFPPMPDEKILPILTQQQQIVWKGITKRKLGYWGLGNRDEHELEEEVWPEDSPNKAEARGESLPPPREAEPANGGAKP
jgi:hypothetical protein